MSLALINPQQTVAQAVEFIQKVFADQKKNQAIIAVSGGIDSAVACNLLVKALGSTRVAPLLLPYGTQDMADAEAVLQQAGVAASQWHTINIASIVEAAQTSLGLVAPAPALLPGQTPTQTSPTEVDRLRLGNLMARARMVVVFDTAKKLDAMVCGTENKSEHYLGYFTRFGDSASDLEPIAHLYKTQVRQIAEVLQVPTAVQTKAPSAGLWVDQTDEHELGFSYQKADQVLETLFDQTKNDIRMLTIDADWQKLAETPVNDVEQPVVAQVVNQVKSSVFKLLVPYQLYVN